jgi:hypothetical protein
MEQCREVMRFRRLALRSEQAYLDWIKRFMGFHREKDESGKWQAENDGWRHPKDMGERDPPALRIVAPLWRQQRRPRGIAVRRQLFPAA